jgi:phage shock protein A
MATEIGSMFWKIGADLGDLVKGIKDSKSEVTGLENDIKPVNTALDKMEDEAKSAGNALDKMGDDLKGAGNSASNAGDKFDSLMTAFTGINQAVQLAQQAYAALEGVYDKVITQTVEYAEEVRQLSRTIGSTPEDASKLIQAADDVKVSFSDLTTGMNIAIRNGLSPTIEGMGALADQYLAIEDPIERSKFLLDSFGRSGANLAPLMEKGAKGIKELGDAAKEVGLVLDQKALDSTREYEIAVDNLTDSWQGFAVTVGTEAIPAIVKLLDQFTDSANISNMREEVNIFASALRNAGEITDKEYNEIMKESYNRNLSTGESLISLSSAVESLKAQYADTGAVVDTTAEEMIRSSINAGIAAEKINQINLADARAEYEETAAVLNDQLAQAYDNVKSAEDRWRSGVAGQIKGEVEKEFKDGAISVDEYRGALETLDATYGTGFAIDFAMTEQIPDLVRALLEDPQSFVDKAAAFENYFMPLDTAVKESKKEVELLQGMLNDLEKTYTATIRIITLGSANVDSVGNVGGQITGGIDRDATGGKVRDDKLLMVGETGPELFIPDSAGVIVPNHKLTGAADTMENGEGYGGNRVVQLLEEIASNRTVDEMKLARVLRDALLQVVG